MPALRIRPSKTFLQSDQNKNDNRHSLNDEAWSMAKLSSIVQFFLVVCKKMCQLETWIGRSRKVCLLVVVCHVSTLCTCTTKSNLCLAYPGSVTECQASWHVLVRICVLIYWAWWPLSTRKHRNMLSGLVVTRPRHASWVPLRFCCVASQTWNSHFFTGSAQVCTLWFLPQSKGAITKNAIWSSKRALNCFQIWANSSQFSLFGGGGGGGEGMQRHIELLFLEPLLMPLLFVVVVVVVVVVYAAVVFCWNCCCWQSQNLHFLTVMRRALCCGDRWRRQV